MISICMNYIDFGHNFFQILSVVRVTFNVFSLKPLNVSFLIAEARFPSG